MHTKHLLAILLASAVLGCQPTPTAPAGEEKRTGEEKLTAEDFKPMNWDRSGPLADRVGRDTGTEELRLYSEREDLTPYTPTAKEREIIRQCLDRLPPLHKKVLQEDLYAIHFMNNLPRPEVPEVRLRKFSAAYLGHAMVFNPDCLKGSVSDYLARQESNYFEPGDPWTLLKIDCGKDLPAFQYVLLREATRLVIWRQYVHLTGFVPAFQPVTDCFAADTWDQNKCLPLAKARMAVFGWWDEECRLDEEGIEIPLAGVSFDKAVDYYKVVGGSKLVSLRSAAGLHEDIAEFVTFYHLTHKMNQTYRIRITHDFPKQEERFVWEPMKKPDSNRVLAVEEFFYTKPQPTTVYSKTVTSH